MLYQIIKGMKTFSLIILTNKYLYAYSIYLQYNSKYLFRQFNLLIILTSKYSNLLVNF